MGAEVTIPEFVYEFREWESHHRRWTMGEYEDLFAELGKPQLVAFHGGLEAHIQRIKANAAEIKQRFDTRYANGRRMTPAQLRKDR